jgi:threonine/homoserine/homoserine lactone efflux protein
MTKQGQIDHGNGRDAQDQAEFAPQIPVDCRGRRVYPRGVPPTTHLLTFAITAFVLIAVPGPSVLFVVSRAIALGRVVGVATVAGNTVGAFVQVTAVAFGIGPLVERSVALFTIMKLAGAGYLMFLGVQAIRHRRSLTTALGAQVEQKTAARIVLDGFTVGATNPKVIVFFAAMLPQFVDRQAGDVPTQIIVLGAIFAAIALLSDSTWALVAGTARAWLARSPRRLELIGGTSGLVMIGIGVRLALTGRKD